MEKTTVVNTKTGQPYDIRIDKNTKYANPFKIGIDGDRELVLFKYLQWVRCQPTILHDLPYLKGKRLGCHCHPKHCHGDILARLADNSE